MTVSSRLADSLGRVVPPSVARRLPGADARADDTAPRWTNWGGNVSCRPREVLHPASEAEVGGIVTRAAEQGGTVRAVGAGHSFTPCAATDGTMLSLDRMQGLEHHDPETGLVTVLAGTRLFNLNTLLAGLGRAQENMGDINHQSLAGATATGTHGTGVTLGSISTQVESLRLVDGQGQVRTIDGSDADQLAAARLSLGALGLVTAVTLRTVPAYTLRMSITAGRWQDMLEHGLEHAQAHRHFEYYWIPFTDSVQVKQTDITDEPPVPDGPVQVFNDRVLENGGVLLLNAISRAVPRLNQAVCGVMGSLVTSNTRVQPSHDVFGSARSVRFTEMEYGVPVAELPDVLRELRAAMEAARFPIAMPIEVRYAAADDVWLSTAHRRDVAYVAIHCFRGVDGTGYFDTAERIFLAHGGRPHWGKCHSLTASDFAERLEHFDDFLALRDQADPQRVFANDYTRRVLGE